MRVSPFPPLHVDLIFGRICCYLSIKEYGRLMRVNHLFWETFITDLAWTPHYERMTKAMPALKEHVFDVYPWKSSGENDGERDVKRAKFAKNKGANKARPLIMPRGGVYYVMRHFIYPMCSIKGIKKLCSLTTPSHFQDRDPSAWTLRDRTVWHLFSIVFSFVLPPELGAKCLSCVVKRVANQWFRVDMTIGKGTPMFIRLHHADLYNFTVSEHVQSTHEFWILERFRCLVLMCRSTRSPHINFQFTLQHQIQ